MNIYSLQKACNLFNRASCPATPRTESGHCAARKAANKALAYIRRHPMGSAVKEYSNGSLWVMRYN